MLSQADSLDKSRNERQKLTLLMFQHKVLVQRQRQLRRELEIQYEKMHKPPALKRRGMAA